MAKERLDVLLVNRGLAASREKAKAIIMSGNVYVDGQKEDKAGQTFPEEANIEVRGSTLKYVSRGGLKLEKAMECFDVSLSGKICMDVGSSTGGFTDCMLQNGAVKVYAVDVGHGQLDWKLRNDQRVICMEKTNIRYVKPEDIEDRIQFSSIDHCILAGIRSQKHHRDIRVRHIFPDMLQRFDSIHDRHLNIQKDQVRFSLLQIIQRNLSARNRDNLIGW